MCHSHKPSELPFGIPRGLDPICLEAHTSRTTKSWALDVQLLQPVVF
jgi:hypothetical protein